MNTRSPPGRPSGFVLLPVVLTLALVAALAFLMGREAAVGVDQAAREGEDTMARFVAEAALSHALWVANDSACIGYTLPTTAFGAHAYGASFNPSNGSPVTVAATATLASGVSRTVTRDRVRVYESPIGLTLRAGGPGGVDTYLNQSNPAQTNGSRNTLHVRGQDGESEQRRALLRFDLTAIPPEVQVQRAVLELELKNASGAPRPVGVHRVTGSWSEAEGSWNERSAGQAWAAAGGDLAAEPVDTIGVGPTTGARYQWQVTALVAAWLAGIYANDGLALAGAGSGVDERFFSGDEGNPSRRPRLVITYRCECGSGAAGRCESCAGTFRDEFNADSYSGSDGSRDWATDWLEINEADGPGAGDEAVADDQSDYQLRVQNNDNGGEGVEREADLSSYSSATLSFDYRRHSLDDPADYVSVAVSSDGGASWTELDRFEDGEDSSYQSASYDITAHIAPNTRIRFLGSADLGGGDRVWFDNVQICVNN